MNDLFFFFFFFAVNVVVAADFVYEKHFSSFAKADSERERKREKESFDSEVYSTLSSVLSSVHRL